MCASVRFLNEIRDGSLEHRSLQLEKPPCRYTSRTPTAYIGTVLSEANFDSNEADPFEDKKKRQERKVKGLLDKVSLITALDRTR